MKMEEIEKSEGIKFPDLFRKIYESGAMTWMTESDSWIDEHREELENAHGTFMWGVEVDWEPLLFEEIEEEQDYMMSRITGNSTHIRSLSKFEEPNMKFGL